MKDITSTTFGLVIAYLLPGLTALYAIALWSNDIRGMLGTFTKAESNVGLFFLVVLIALTLGLQVSAVRWVIYEKWLCKSHRLEPEMFANLGTSDKLLAFKAAVEEGYRYHQFWGGISVVAPILFFGYLYLNYLDFSGKLIGLYIFIFLVVEIFTCVAARFAYVNYIARARKIMEGT